MRRVRESDLLVGSSQKLPMHPYRGMAHGTRRPWNHSYLAGVQHINARTSANWFVFELRVQRDATSSFVVVHESTTGNVTGSRGLGRGRRSSKRSTGSSCSGKLRGSIPETTDAIVARGSGAGR